MKRPGRPAGHAALATFGVLAVAACSSGPVLCKPCAGGYVDPNGLIGPHDQVASVRVCIDSVCRTVHYQDFGRRPSRYANVYGTYPRNHHRIESIEITTFDAHNKVVRVATGGSIDLPNVKPRHDPCACSDLKIAYDNTGERFVVSAQ